MVKGAATQSCAAKRLIRENHINIVGWPQEYRRCISDYHNRFSIELRNLLCKDTKWKILSHLKPACYLQKCPITNRTGHSPYRCLIRPNYYPAINSLRKEIVQGVPIHLAEGSSILFHQSSKWMNRVFNTWFSEPPKAKSFCFTLYYKVHCCPVKN